MSRAVNIVFETLIGSVVTRLSTSSTESAWNVVSVVCPVDITWRRIRPSSPRTSPITIKLCESTETYRVWLSVVVDAIDVRRMAPVPSIPDSVFGMGRSVMCRDAPDPFDAASARPAVRYDWREGDSPFMAIIEAVAAATNRDPTDLPPLQHRLDGDALDALLDDTGPASAEGIRVSFSYAGVDIAVDSDGDVAVWLPGSE